MKVFSRIVLFAIVTSSLLDLARPSGADAAQCPCTSNSPTVNPFPYRSLRWGTSQVLKGTPECPITGIKNPRIAIKWIDNGDPSRRIRGYQLVVVGDDNLPKCDGTKLAGVVFNHLYTEHDEPVVIRQMALARVTPDVPGKDECFIEEYRLVYLIASVHRPDDSVCRYELNNGRARRAWRYLFGFGLPVLPSPERSEKLSELPLVLPDQLASYAVAIPDADYDSDGTPQTSDSEGLSAVPAGVPEWYELACGGGALAHTELTGLVEPGDSKKVRTAAMRMLRANYRGNRSETLEGIPIRIERNLVHSAQYNPQCTKSPPAGMAHASTIGEADMEARWTETGALCVSRSRLWMKDGVITAAQQYPRVTLKDSERAFLDAIRGKPGDPVVEVPCKPAPQDWSLVWFTSGVLNHIRDH